MRRLILPLLLTIAAAGAARAQDTIPRPAQERRLPPEVAERVTSFFNDPGTLHFTGDGRIPAGRTVQGDVALLDGTLSIAGRVEGSVAVINGTVELAPGAVVTGGITVVGGRIVGAEQARVGGELAAYSERMDYARRGDRIYAEQGRRPGEGRAAEEGDDDAGWVTEGRTARYGRAEFIIATGNSYNRVEGMPITFGPVLETAGRNPLRLRAMGIYRTEEGPELGPERWGYEARLEQFLGGERALRVGVSAYRRIDPIEEWHLSKLENGLSTFFLHRDYRDHYEREGAAAFAVLEPIGSPLSLRAEYRTEKHRTEPAGSPWTLFNNNDAWRAQPLVGQGRLNSVALSGRLDTRSRADDPSTGWLLQAELEQDVGSSLVRPQGDLADGLPVIPGGGPPFPERPYGRFTSATVDLRRYNRIGPWSRLNLRVLAGGSISGALPPQRQHALGGEGSLPGFALFSLDCGARSVHVYRHADVARAGAGEQPPAYFPAYGCDRFALGQAEYRGDLKFHLNWRGDYDSEGDDAGDADDDTGERRGRRRARVRTSFDANLGWVLFADAGQGWTSQADMHDERAAVDVGAGILLGRLGIYGAVPVSRGGGMNLFIRLSPRI